MIWILMLTGFLLLLGALSFLVAGTGTKRRDVADREPATIILREERLKLRKTREQLAEVTTHREVTRIMKTITVPVSKEELVVERDGVEAARIPLREDRIDVSTHSVPLKEVSVYKREWEEDREVQALLKKEVARIETTGDAPYTEQESP